MNAMKGGLVGGRLMSVTDTRPRRPWEMLCVGLDLSRKRFDFHALSEEGELVERGAVTADRDGLTRVVFALVGAIVRCWR
jgi:hypothetical protein